MSCKLSAALHTACADVLGEPVYRVELTPVYDSNLSGTSPHHFHASCDHLRAPSLTLLVNDAESYAVGHDLNAFGNGGPLAPLSVPRSYDIPGDFLGTHTFPRVQVFSVGIKPPTISANVVQPSNAEQAHAPSHNHSAVSASTTQGAYPLEVIDLTQDSDDLVQPVAAPSHRARPWRAICFVASLALTALAVNASVRLMYMGATLDCSTCSRFLQQISSGFSAAVFMKPGAARVHAEEPEPASSMHAHDSAQSSYQIIIPIVLVISLTVSAFLVLQGLLQIQQRLMTTGHFEPHGLKSQAASASADTAQVAGETSTAPADGLQAASSSKHAVQAEVAQHGEAKSAPAAAAQYAHYANNNAMPATITAQDADKVQGNGLSDSDDDWEPV